MAKTGWQKIKIIKFALKSLYLYFCVSVFFIVHICLKGKTLSFKCVDKAEVRQWSNADCEIFFQGMFHGLLWEKSNTHFLASNTKCCLTTTEMKFMRFLKSELLRKHKDGKVVI